MTSGTTTVTKSLMATVQSLMSSSSSSVAATSTEATLASISPASILAPSLSNIQIGPISASGPQVVLLGCLLGSYACAQYYWTRLLGQNYPRLKQLFLATIGHLFLLAVHPSWATWLNVYGPSMVVWWVLRERRWRSNPAVPVRLFIGLLVHLSLCHLVRQWRWRINAEADDSMDQTTVLMLLLIKLSSFAFDIGDAIRYLRTHNALAINERRIQTRSKTAAAAAASDKLTTSQNPNSNQISEAEDREAKMNSLARYPSLLEFIGYVFFFPGLLVGPAISFWEYRQFVEETGPFGQIAKAPPGSPVLQGRKRRALRLFLTGLLCLVGYTLLRDRINVHGYFADERVIRQGWPFRLAYLHVAVIVLRLKYYFAWMISEGAHVLLGIAYRPSPTTGRPLWDRTSNISMRRIEAASDFRRVIADWNVCTNRWLYTYVYKRIATTYYGSHRKPAGFRASLATYVVSAIWHGFYPAYYAVFVTGAFYTFASKLIYNTFTWPWGSRSRKAILWAPNHLIVDYCTASFVLLHWEDTFRFFRFSNYWGHIFLVTTIIILQAYQYLRGRGSKKLVATISG